MSGKMAPLSVMSVLLYIFGLFSLGLCQYKLKDQPTDTRSHLRMPPKLGLGTWYLNLSVKNTTEAVAGAIAQGYRHIDGAPIYENERGVGLGIKEGLRRANLKRSDIWITTKLWDDHHTRVERGISQTLKAMGLDYIDLYLMHFPMGPLGTFDHVPTWKSMEKLIRPNGPTRYIGVANLGPDLLDPLLRNATFRPLVHQMEVHPYLQQRDWVKHNQNLNLTVIAYAPLGNTSPTYRKTFYANSKVYKDLPMLLENETIKKIAEARKCAPSQVVLGWNLRHGVTVIPKSSHLDRQKENMGASTCKLTDEDDKLIAGIEKKYGPRRMLNVCAIFSKNCYNGLTGLDRWKSWSVLTG